MSGWERSGIGVLRLTSVVWAGAAQAVDSPEPNLHPIPDLAAARLRRDPDGLEDVRLGAGMALPLSERAQLYGEYRFLRGRLDAGVGRGLLQRELDTADFRAGFSIRLD